MNGDSDDNVSDVETVRHRQKHRPTPESDYSDDDSNVGVNTMDPDKYISDGGSAGNESDKYDSDDSIIDNNVSDDEDRSMYRAVDMKEEEDKEAIIKAAKERKKAERKKKAEKKLTEKKLTEKKKIHGVEKKPPEVDEKTEPVPDSELGFSRYIYVNKAFTKRPLNEGETLEVLRMSKVHGPYVGALRKHQSAILAEVSKTPHKEWSIIRIVKEGHKKHEGYLYVFALRIGDNQKMSHEIRFFSPGKKIEESSIAESNPGRDNAHYASYQGDHYFDGGIPAFSSAIYNSHIEKAAKRPPKTVVTTIIPEKKDLEKTVHEKKVVEMNGTKPKETIIKKSESKKVPVEETKKRPSKAPHQEEPPAKRHRVDILEALRGFKDIANAVGATITITIPPE